MKENYQLYLDKTLKYLKENDIKPNLLLHSCCAPCSSYCIEYLSEFFNITLYFYNPNISKQSEFDKRANELLRLINSMPLPNKVDAIIEHYTPNEFYDVSKGLENEPERGKRCKECFYLRLNKAAEYAKQYNFDYFTTTLSISPHKDAMLLNQIGKELSDIYDIPYLFSDFKKRNGYKRSIELSTEYNLYRQNFCGCIFSYRDSNK